MAKTIKQCEEKSSVVRVLQLTDAHLFAEPDATLLGMQTELSFKAVLLDVIQRNINPDLILLTGDLSQDRSEQAYLRLREHVLANFTCPVFWIPGNHDDFARMSRILLRDNLYSDKHIVVGNWNIVLLNSQVERKVHGWLSESELKFMRDALQAFPEHHPLVVMHHHPIDMQCDWIDTIGIQNAERFWEALESETLKAAVLWGHVHQELSALHNGFHCMATPSTCVQFKPGAVDFAADDIGPGYRILDLHQHGQVETCVNRLPMDQFRVDHSIKGY
ncbi:MAG: 3',5'-cyclic-AMP phosphodiesterase [Pseudomonadota bacterium]